MSNYEREKVLAALQFPRSWIFSMLNKRQCEHGVFHSPRATDCVNCDRTEECKWLSYNDQFNNLEQRNLSELKQSLEEAVDLIESEAFKYEEHPASCQCEACRWITASVKMIHPALE